MGGATSHTQKDKLMREDIARFWFTEFQSRTRMYPQDITAPITLASDAVANTFGNWTEIIAANLIAFPFHVHSLQTMGASGADSFFIQLASSATPSGSQILGEKAFALAAAGRARVDLACPTVFIGTPIYGRVKTGAGATTIDVTVSIVRCICTTDLLKLLAEKRTTWP